MSRSRYYFRVVGLLLLLFNLSLLSCGLPDSRAISGLSPSTPNIQQAYNNGTETTLEIENDYKASDFPDFDGFNIYFNTESAQVNDVLARRLHIYDNTRQPSISIRPDDAMDRVELRFLNTLEYRFTSKATDSDYEDDNVAPGDREDLQDTRLNANETFYVLVKAVNDESESSASDVVAIKVSDTENPNINILDTREHILDSLFLTNEIILTNRGGTVSASIRDEDATITVKAYYTAVREWCYLSISGISETGYGASAVPLPMKKHFLFVYKKEAPAQGGNPALRSYYRFYVTGLSGSNSVNVNLCTNNEYQPIP